MLEQVAHQPEGRWSDPQLQLLDQVSLGMILNSNFSNFTMLSSRRFRWLNLKVSKNTMRHPRLNLSHQSFKDCLYHSLLHICCYRPCINLRGPARSEDAEDRGPDFHDNRENPDQMRRMDDHRTSWWWSALFTGLSKSSSCVYAFYILSELSWMLF